jgi:hypothetical protein
MEFDTLGSSAIEANIPLNLNYGGLADGEFDEVPLELLIDRDPIPSLPPRPFTPQPEETDPNSETREITLEEFSAMLHKDPNLVAELAEQFGVETRDPQEIVNIVIAQMQQQVQQISGDLTPISTESTTSKPQPPTPNAQKTPPPPPPPPAPKLEYKAEAEDPWNNNLLGDNADVLPKTANTPDRGV